jgi:mannose/cellobiose epimerase-like protein (N-acyl-D-glucosamine 2-epimerase family)
MTLNDAAYLENLAHVRQHFEHVVLPLWRGPGFNAELGLPFEALSWSAAVLPVTRYRTMACARQLYVFTQSAIPGDDARASRLFEALQRIFRDDCGGEWCYSVDAGAAVLDATLDLYTYAFIIFACAAYARRFGSPPARELVWRTTQDIERIFQRADGSYDASRRSTSGVSASASPPDATLEKPIPHSQTPHSATLQNPIMHLTEAYLAAHAMFADIDKSRAAHYEKCLLQIADVMTQVFVVAENGCIAEAPVGTRDNRLEPGHQFEWFSLVKTAPHVFGETALWNDVDRAFDFAQCYGVSVVTHGVCEALSPAGAPHCAAERIWAQTEYLRALAVSGQTSTLSETLASFRCRFLHSRGWYEVIAPDGTPMREDMPSTTPYHMATAYNAFPATA